LSRRICTKREEGSLKKKSITSGEEHSIPGRRKTIPLALKKVFKKVLFCLGTGILRSETGASQLKNTGYQRSSSEDGRRRGRQIHLPGGVRPL